MSDFLGEWKNNKQYFDYLEMMASLSGLFSDSDIPYLDYRISENLFCKCFEADNLSRSDTAYDARLKQFGVGIKTFQFTTKDGKSEKVAEFNKISKSLKQYKGLDLAYNVALARNERIELGKRNYAINDAVYHIVARVKNGLVIFNTPYKLINLDKIHNVKDTESSLQFQDDTDEYSFNYSKSTLFKKFYVPDSKVELKVNIIDDPYTFVKDAYLYNKRINMPEMGYALPTELTLPTRVYMSFGSDYVILPLFSTRGGVRNVPAKSGLNQWNAAGRPRNANEVYIPIPLSLHKKYPNFFPQRDTIFNLNLPNGKNLKAKVCQDGGKALMSNPNSDLGKWILRDILVLKEYELATIERLDLLGFDSVIISKTAEDSYSIDICREIRYTSDIYLD